MNTWPMAKNHDAKGTAKFMMSIGFLIMLNRRPEPHGMQSIIPLRVALVLQSLVFLSSSKSRSLIDTSRCRETKLPVIRVFAKQQQGGRERRPCPAPKRLVDVDGNFTKREIESRGIKS